MKYRKIVDTVVTFGAAEKQIAFNTDFEKFIKSSYGKVDLLKVNPEEIIKKYNLKGFVFGNYVTQEERYHFLYKIGRQLELLSKIALTNDLGKGILIIAFGSEGRAPFAAHYNPKSQLINLNRGRKGDYKNILQGENSFIHEYGHFIDFLQGQKDKNIGHKNIGVNFASESTNLKGTAKSLLFSDVVDKIELNQKYIKGLKGRSNSKYLKSRIELFARFFEASISYYAISKWKNASEIFDVSQYRSNIYLTKTELKEGGFLKDSVNILQGKVNNRGAIGTNRDKEKAAPKTEKKEVIHYYPQQNAFSKSPCGIEFSEIKDSTNQEKYITCLKCLKIVTKKSLEFKIQGLEKDEKLLIETIKNWKSDKYTEALKTRKRRLKEVQKKLAELRGATIKAILTKAEKDYIQKYKEYFHSLPKNSLNTNSKIKREVKAHKKAIKENPYIYVTVEEVIEMKPTEFKKFLASDNEDIFKDLLKKFPFSSPGTLTLKRIYADRLQAISKRNSKFYYIKFLNKEKNFKEDKKTFSSYGAAERWGKKELPNFNLDMIKEK